MDGSKHISKKMMYLSTGLFYYYVWTIEVYACLFWYGSDNIKKKVFINITTSGRN